MPKQKHNPTASPNFFTRLVRGTIGFFSTGFQLPSVSPVQPGSADAEAEAGADTDALITAVDSNTVIKASAPAPTAGASTAPKAKKLINWNILKVFQGGKSCRGYDNPPRTLIPAVMSTTMLAGIIPAVPRVHGFWEHSHMQRISDIGYTRRELRRGFQDLEDFQCEDQSPRMEWPTGDANIEWYNEGDIEEIQSGESGNHKSPQNGNENHLSRRPQIGLDYDEEDVDGIYQDGGDCEEAEEVYDFQSMNSGGYQGDIDSTTENAGSDNGSVNGSVEEEIYHQNFQNRNPNSRRRLHSDNFNFQKLRNGRNDSNIDLGVSGFESSTEDSSGIDESAQVKVSAEVIEGGYTSVCNNECNECNKGMADTIRDCHRAVKNARITRSVTFSAHTFNAFNTRHRNSSHSDPENIYAPPRRNRTRAYTTPSINPNTGNIIPPPGNTAVMAEFLNSILARLTPRSKTRGSVEWHEDTIKEVEVVIKILEEGDAKGAKTSALKKENRKQARQQKQKKNKYTWEELSEMEYLEERRRGWGY
ncbi:hypothetical protein FPQ18DRAFT_309602 [Pyronema domesticum]|uniref:Uncharacterized protein n=1 Tax=Pyronema omphalodes (strain CBS 100304) TaxID=1076935 RepID=U4L9G3_PYROM|nr:hypothetical protein FPQ18DRAFT_309602 [Pyronema domesticum]CCX06824.1 Protein of unknown function [Pyronema omphalodes CBS 100304]